MTVKPFARLIRLFQAVYLGANILLASLVLWDLTSRTRLLVVALPVAVGLVAARRAWLPHALAAFGAGLVFFGFQSYSPQSLVLHLVVSWLAACLACGNPAGRAHPGGPSPLRVWLAAFVSVALAGLPWLPLGEFAEAVRELGPVEFARMAAFSPARSSLYALAALNRLVLFALLAWELSRVPEDKALPALAEGIGAGVPAVVAFGLWQYFSGRGQAFAMSDRLTSLFLNPGWFAEYVCLAFPFLFVLGKCRGLGRWLFFTVLAACLAAMVLTMARAAWIVFGLLAVWTVVSAVAGWDLFALNHCRLVRGSVLGLAGVVTAALLVYAGLATSRVSLLNFPLATMLQERLERFSETPRPAVFKTGVLVGLESPLAGVGYESYAWHYPHLMDAPAGLLARYGDPRAEVFEATHNVFIQIFAGTGAMGLSLWLLLAGRALGLELAGHRRRGDPLSLAVAAMILAFHAFGLFQEMIYIPAVWLLFFLGLAHALRLEDERGGFASARTGRVAVLVCTGFAILALGVNLVQADGLAANLGLKAYPSPERRDTQGFVGPDLVDGRTALWSVGSSSFVLTGQGPWTFETGCPHPDLNERPVRIAFRTENGVVAQAEFDATRGRTARVTIPREAAAPGSRVYVHVSRSYCPMAAGVKDFRCLGAWIAGPGLTE